MSKKQKIELFWVAFNSASAYSTAMIWLVFAERFFQAFVAKWFGIQSHLYYHRLDMISGRDAWTRTAVFVTYLSPSVFALILGFFFLYWYFSYRRSAQLIRLYLFWAMLASFNLFLSNFLYSAFVYKGLAVALRWWYLPQTVNTVLGMVGGVLLFFVGIFWVKPLLKMAPSKDWEVHTQPRFFLLFVAILPYVFSSLGFAFLLFTSAETRQIALLHGSVGIMLLGSMVLAMPSDRKIILVKDFPINRFSWSSFLFVLISVILLKLSLYRGFTF